ncbi:SEC14-like protein 4 [Sitodiplosis mosellana]|uniref:SEC14-like protein 4 n=1 Tax=Sitodiplosis mosellana TaxID=263140 RepID=UPI002444A64E|nr:SEC14-like protein 4 [Sitodiplosis mosellana]
MAPEKKSPTLQDDQKFTLMKFRRTVADITKPEHDDFYLIRWLNARNWDANAAEKMLRESMKWRERWNVDNILDWKTPQPLADYSPHGISGFDKEGSPIIVVPFAGMDMWGMLHTVSRADFIRSTIKTLETYMKLAFEQSVKHGPQARQFVVLFDMAGFNVKQYTWRPAAEVVISLIKSYEANYPEILKCCYIINVPKVFAIVFNIVKRFLDEYTLGKILIFKQDSKKWLPKMLEHVDPSQIPKYFGGTQTDEDGDPKCMHKVNWGGKVPKELYIMRDEKDNNNEDFVDTMIKKGSKIKLEFKCKDAGCALKWEFRTFDHDIRFGIKRINEQTGEENIEVDMKRVASHQLDEEGYIACQPDWTYVVVFDNSYSYFKNKRIRYQVILSEPVSVDELEKGAAKLECE